MPGQKIHGDGVVDAHREWLRPRTEEKREVLVRRIERSERALERDLPDDHRAEQDPVRPIPEVIQRALAQPLVSAHEPERGVRVQEEIQRALNASAMSSGSSSRSSAMCTRPRSAPYTEASELVRMTGRSRATGSPFRAITMSSPA